jgi:methionine-gamma-lyase
MDDHSMTHVANVAAQHIGDSRGVNPPTDASSTFSVDDLDNFGRWFMGADGVPEGSYLYARQSHPSAVHLGEMLAALEGAEAGYVTASGLSACGAALLRYATHGDTLVVSDRLYGGLRALCNLFAERFGIRVIPVDITDLRSVERACRRKCARALYTEVASNPDMVVADIPRLADIAHARGIPLIVDNTFTPLAIRPLALGADVVVHSLTKYVSGTSKVMAGGIVGSHEIIRSLMHPTTGLLMLLGPVLASEAADKLREHLPSLALRFTEASKRALTAAMYLQSRGFSVCYPGLLSSSGCGLYYVMAAESSGQAYGAGGVFSVVLDSYASAKRFSDLLAHIAFAKKAVSLGSAHTYVLPYGCDETFPPLWKNPLPFHALPPGIVRIAIGYEGDRTDMMERLELATETFLKTHKAQ